MIRKTLHTLLLFAVLFGTWLVFSGIHTPRFYLFGLISSALATALALRMNVVDNEGHPFHLAFTAPLYWLWLLKEMVKSGLGVTKLVWSPNETIAPHFAWLKITQNCDLGRTIYANSITLTPGTVCIDIENKRVFVHALEKASIRDLENGNMDRRVSKLTSNSDKHYARTKTGKP